MEINTCYIETAEHQGQRDYLKNRQEIKKRERERETNGIKRNYKRMKENLNSHNGSQRKAELYFQNAKRKQENCIKKKKKSECLMPSETSKKFPKK